MDWPLLVFWLSVAWGVSLILMFLWVVYSEPADDEDEDPWD